MLSNTHERLSDPPMGIFCDAILHSSFPIWLILYINHVRYLDRNAKTQNVVFVWSFSRHIFFGEEGCS